jgi:hypothetical protein
LFFKVHGLFISLSTFNWRHSPKSLSSAETDLVESTTVQQLWAYLTTKKQILNNFLKSSKLSIVAAKIIRIMSPYTSNALDSHTVLHTLWACPHRLLKLPESTQREQAIPNNGSLFYSHCEAILQLAALFCIHCVA